MKKPLSLTFVLYEEGDLVGKLLAYATLTPVAVVVSLLTLILFHRHIRTVVFLAGLTLNHLLCMLLKRLLQLERPQGSDREDFGMPSNHGQFMGFFATYAIVLLHRYKGPFWPIRWLSSVTVIAAALVVGYSRVYLGYHTAEQVAVGLLCGFLLAIVWPKIPHEGKLWVPWDDKPHSQ